VVVLPYWICTILSSSLNTVFGIILIQNSSDGYYLFDHCANRNVTALVYWLLTCMGQLRVDGRCCRLDMEFGRRTKINWTKNCSQHTLICRRMSTPQPCANTYKHKHTFVWYGLSTGPTDVLSSWWPSSRSWAEQPTIEFTSLLPEISSFTVVMDDTYRNDIYNI